MSTLDNFVNINNLLNLCDDPSAEYYSVALDINGMFTGKYTINRASLLGLPQKGKVQITFGEKLEDIGIIHTGKEFGYNFRMKLFN